jgi:hypothetical protein
MGNHPSYDLRPRANGRTIAVVALALAEDGGYSFSGGRGCRDDGEQMAGRAPRPARMHAT